MNFEELEIEEESYIIIVGPENMITVYNLLTF